mgnify:CR=1 FL=1
MKLLGKKINVTKIDTHVIAFPDNVFIKVLYFDIFCLNMVLK